MSEDSELYEVESHIRHTWRSDGSEEISISSSDAQRVHAKLTADGTVIFTMHGSAPQGEVGADSTAWILVERLNQLGGNWSNPVRPAGVETGVDFTATSGSETLYIQVTRAFTDGIAWRELASGQFTTRVLELPEAIDHVMAAIEHKALRIPAASRAAITLALDTALPAAFAPVRFMIDFKKRHAVAVQQLGFKSVWIVGPTPSLTWRVDQPFPHGEPITIGF